MGICIANERLNMESGKSDCSPNVMTKPLCASPNKQYNLVDECNLFHRIKKWTNLGPEDKFIRCSVSTLDLSPLSNTQPSPKDSGVDVSSPPRRDEEACFSMANNTTMSNPSIKTGCTNKSRFYHCDRKKMLDIKELQAKEFRKIISEPHAKKKNAMSVKKLKSESVKIPDKNYTVVPVARKDSGIIIKIIAKNDSAAKKKNQNKSTGPKNVCKVASMKVAHLAEKTPAVSEKKSHKVLHGTKIVAKACESTKNTSLINSDQQSATYSIKKSCDNLDISSSPKKRQSADESYTLTSVKKQKTDNPNNDLDILKIKISCKSGLLKLKPTRLPCSVPPDINGQIEKVTVGSRSTKKLNKLRSRTTDKHLNDLRVERERKVKFSGNYSHGGMSNQNPDGYGPENIVKHVPAKEHNSSTGLLKISQDYASIECKSSPPPTNNQVESHLQISQLEKYSPKMSRPKNSCTQTNSIQNSVAAIRNKKTKLLGINSTDHKVSPLCSQTCRPNEPELSNVRTIFLPGGKRKINLFLRPPKQENQDISNISDKSNLESSKPELNADSNVCKNNFFTDDLTDSSTSDLNSLYELKPFLLENKIKIRKKRIPALKLTGLKVDDVSGVLKNETDDKIENNVCKNNFSSAMCIGENDSGESRTFCNDEVSANKTFTTYCSLNRSSTSINRSLDQVVHQSEKQRKWGQNTGNNSLLSSEDINCDMQNKERSVQNESKKDVGNSSCLSDEAVSKSTEKLTHEEWNDDVKTLKIKKKKKAEKLTEIKKCIRVEPVVKKEPKWKKKSSPLEKLIKNVLDLPEKYEVYDPEMNIKREVNWDSLNYTNAAQPALKVEKNDVSPRNNCLLVADVLLENRNVCFSEANTGQELDDGKNAAFSDFVAMTENEVCEKVDSNESIGLSNAETKINECWSESDHNIEMKEIQRYNEGNDEKKELEQNYDKFIATSETEGPKYCENVVIPEKNEFVAVKEMSGCGQTDLVKSEKDEKEYIRSNESIVLVEREIVSKEIELLSLDQIDDILPCDAALVLEDPNVMQCGVIPNNGDGEMYGEGVVPGESTFDVKSVVNLEEQYNECGKAPGEEKFEISALPIKESSEINKELLDNVVENHDLGHCNKNDDSGAKELEYERGNNSANVEDEESQEIDELLKCFAISSEESYLLDQENNDLSHFEKLFNECHNISKKLCDPLIGKDLMFEDRLLCDESTVKCDKNCTLISEDLLEGIEPVLELIDDKKTELVENSLLSALKLNLEQKNDFAATDMTMSENREEHSNDIVRQLKTAHKNSDAKPKTFQNEFKRQTELLAETPSELSSCMFSESKKGESSELKSRDVLFTDAEAVSNKNSLTRVPKSRGRKPKSMRCSNTVDDISLKVTELPLKEMERPQMLTDTPAERSFLPEFEAVSEMLLKFNSRKKIAGEHHHSEQTCDGLPLLTGRKSARLSRKTKRFEHADPKIGKEVVKKSIHSSEKTVVLESNGDNMKNQNQEIVKEEEMTPVVSVKNKRNRSVKDENGPASELRIGRKSIHNDSGGLLTQTEELPLDCCKKNAEKLLAVELPSIRKNDCDLDEKVRRKRLNSKEQELTISEDMADQNSSMADQKSLTAQKSLMADQKSSMDDQKLSMADQKSSMTDQKSLMANQKSSMADQKSSMADQKSLMPMKVTRKRSKTNENPTVLPSKMNKKLPASTKDVSKSSESKLLSPHVKKPDTMHGVKYIPASNAGNNDLEDVISLSSVDAELKNSENGLPSNDIDLTQLPGHMTSKPNVMETNSTQENAYKDIKPGKPCKSRRQSLIEKKAEEQLGDSSTKVSAKHNSNAAKLGKTVLPIGAFEERLKTNGNASKQNDGVADVNLIVSVIKKTRSRTVNEKFDKSVQRVGQLKCNENQSIPEFNDVIDISVEKEDQKTKTISKKLPKSLNLLPDSNVFESIIIDSESSCDTVFNYCEVNNTAKKKFIKRSKWLSSKSASIFSTSDEIVDSKLKRESEATAVEENLTNPVGFLNEFAKFLQTSNVEIPSEMDKLEMSGHGMPLLENCDVIKSERLPELEIVPVLDVLIPHSAFSPQLPLSGTSRKVRNINQVVRRQCRIFQRASLSPQMEAFARESRTEIGKKCMSWQESEESSLPSYDKSENIQLSEEIACETCPRQTFAKDYSQTDETEVDLSQFQVLSNEADLTRIAIAHDLKMFVTDQTRLVALRNKAYKLFCCLFPEVQLPLRLSPDSEAVEQLVDSVSAIMGIDEPTKMSTLPSNNDSHQRSPDIVLCRRPLICYRRLKRKLQRLLIQILPHLDLTSDICEEIVEQLIDRVIQANSQPDEPDLTNAGILKRPRNAPTSQPGHDFESPDPFDALPDLTVECSYVSSGSKTSFPLQELNEYLDPPMLTAVGSRDF